MKIEVNTLSFSQFSLYLVMVVTLSDQTLKFDVMTIEFMLNVITFMPFEFCPAKSHNLMTITK